MNPAGSPEINNTFYFTTESILVKKIYEFYKFFNPEMNGFTVYPDFSKLDTLNKNEFIEIWKNCSGDIGIDVKNIDDWSFNKENITDISSCGNHYQRFFKNNLEQQKFLDVFYLALQKVEN